MDLSSGRMAAANAASGTTPIGTTSRMRLKKQKEKDNMKAECPKCGLDFRVKKRRGVSDSLDSLVGKFKDGCLELERQITIEASIGWQGGKWHVFRDSGDSLTEGSGSIYDLICSLAPNAEFSHPRDED